MKAFTITIQLGDDGLVHLDIPDGRVADAEMVMASANGWLQRELASRHLAVRMAEARQAQALAAKLKQDGLRLQS